MRRLLWPALALLAAGCGPKPGQGPAPAPPVEVRVTNHNRSDINLYVTRGGTRSRVGTVVAGNTRAFTLRHLPADPLFQLAFDVQRIGAEGVFQLPRVTISAGQAVRISVEDLITTSEISVSDDGPAPPERRLP